jgi:outer membrane protein OmpA-like peptidoglycan-associated protein
MKARILFTLPLAASLMLPAMAQQAPTDNQQPAASSSESSSQPSSSSSSTSTSSSQTVSSDQNMTARQPLEPDMHQGFWGKMNPFARKKYVQRQTSPIRDRVNELDELTAANGKMIKDVDSRAQQGIQLASNKANEADQHAIDAGNRANTAQQTATAATTRLTSVEQVVGNIDQYTPSTQTEIRFKAGQSVLSKAAKDALDEMATPLKSQRGYIVEVQGFSSGHGQTAIQNSQKMAESVVRYLVLNHDIPVYRVYVVGMGNAPQAATTGDGKAKRTTGGRVEISLLKNNLDQLASSTTAAPASQDQQPAPPK